MDFTINTGGQAGQGIDTIGDLISQVFVKTGFYVHVLKDFESRIRGGYNFNQIRVSDSPIYAATDKVDLIIAMTKEAIVEQRSRLTEGGVIIFDEGIEFEELESCHLSAPLEKVAKEVGGSTRMTNAAALGAALAVLQFPFKLVENALTAKFERKGEKVVASNVAVAKALYDLTTEQFSGTCSQNLSSVKKGPSKDFLFINGNRALALGAMASNVKWISAYPMSPSTQVFQDIVSQAHKLNIGTLQVEDELSAITMALGASVAGARSFVTTSGGGFSLMVEALGLAAITETPIVIYNAQRPGPATGLPTRTEQSDLLFMTHASQGEFPRILLAPKDPVEGFEVATRAFNLADKFQVPVMILGDQHYADSMMNIPRFNVTGVHVDRGQIATAGPDPEYLRYKLTEDGVSPRAFPGDAGKIVVHSGNVHLENGHITENPDLRNAMVEKLMKKVPHILKFLKPPIIYGKKIADITLLTWGSTWGSVNEAVNLLNADGVSINQLHFCDVYPLRTKILKTVFKNAKKVVAVEQNATSQFARLVRMETGLSVDHHINKYDGRQMTGRWVMTQLKEAGIA
ncbi:MAG: 2-oxoacid:acceptor oxidoreductase subunit alpha [Candidatus Thorarchaeota archaeon]|nr:MAG: 2-oxoacid:acceptor oxidoreductase subunit alpha [Candidatus Thorarchaeota archaeon]